RDVPFVRLPALAKFRDISLVNTPGGVSILSPVSDAARTAMEIQLLGERALYVAQRYPSLLNWYGELGVYDVLDTDETKSLLRNATIFADSTERMTDALQTMPDAKAMQQTIGELNATLTQAGPLLVSMRTLIGDLNQTLGATERVLAPFETRAVGGG